MTLFISLFGIAIVVVGFVLIELFLFRKERIRSRKRYLLRERKDQLVLLAIESKINLNDVLFKEVFQFLDSFEDVCDHVSLKHVLEELERRKMNPFNQKKTVNLIDLVEKSPKEVQVVVKTALRESALMIISNSLSVRFVFYLLKIAVLKKLPRWVRAKVKKIFGSKWETAKSLLTIDEHYGLKAA